MMFHSRGKSPALLYRTGGVRYIDTPQGAQRVVVRPKWIKFQAMNAPIFQPGLPGKGSHANEAWGALNTELVANQIDEPEEEIIEYLKNHVDYGIQFLAVSEETGTETDLVDSEMIIPSGKKLKSKPQTFFCKLCEKSLSSPQAVNGHKTSQKHQDLRESYLKHLRTSRQHIRIK